MNSSKFCMHRDFGVAEYEYILFRFRKYSKFKMAEIEKKINKTDRKYTIGQ